MNPLPPISKVYSLLQQVESQRENIPPPPSFSGDCTAFSANSSTAPYRKYSQKVNFNPQRSATQISPLLDSKSPILPTPNSSRGSLFCNCCKRSGHTAEKCY